MFVKPTDLIDAAGNPVTRRVLDPIHKRPIPPEGANVVPSPYWTRRIEFGEVVEIEAPGELAAAGDAS